MSEPRKRRWFQLHLSTCVVLMIVAGFLVFLNLDVTLHYWKREIFGASGMLTRGWPVIAHVRYLTTVNDIPTDLSDEFYNPNSQWIIEGISYKSRGSNRDLSRGYRGLGMVRR